MLVFPFGLLSHYLRCLVLCRELSAFFEIRFAAHPSYQKFIEEEGFDSFACEGFDSSLVVDELKRFEFSWLKSELPEKLFDQQVAIIKRFRPVAVLGDHTPTLKMAAEATGVFYLSLINGYLSNYYADNRAVSRRHPMFKWIRLVKDPLRTKLVRWGEARAFRDLHKKFRVIRRRNGLQQKHHYLEELEGDLTLICDLPELFPQKPFPKSYLNIGPLFYDQGVPGTQDAVHPDPLRKCIVVAMGSTGDWKNVSWLNDSFYSRYTIIALGDKESVLNAPHVIHAEFANCDQLFPLAHLLICHGGNGTLYQGLLYRLPILAFTAHCEQEWNIHALEKFKLAICLDSFSDAEQYRIMVEQLLEDENAGIRTTFQDAVSTAVRDLPVLSSQIASSVISGKAGYYPEHTGTTAPAVTVCPGLK